MNLRPTTELRVSLWVGPSLRSLGRLVWVSRRVLFEFDAGFLADPLPISPAKLPVQLGVHEDPRRTFEGLFGVFADSLPDGWGRLLLDRELRRRGLEPAHLNPLDRLALVGESGPGALIYQPAVSTEAPSVLELERLAHDVDAVLEGSSEAVFPELLALGGSSGGARPKVLLLLRPEDGALLPNRSESPAGFVPALLKFPIRTDPTDVGALEQAYARAARRAGLVVAPTWLVGTNDSHPGYFATQRFDRELSNGMITRVHLHSLAGLLHADHRVPSLDYSSVLQAVRWLTRDQRAVEQLYLRMVFNVLAHNRDDHSRNFAFLMHVEEGVPVWRLAPAYDLTWSDGPGGEHWTTVAGEGKAPAKQHMLRVAETAGVSAAVANRLIDQVRGVIAEMPAIMDELGVSAATRRRVIAVLSRPSR